MGKGKGAVEFWAAKVKPGRIMFEIDGVDEDVAKEALRLAAMKLPIKTPHRRPRGLVRIWTAPGRDQGRSPGSELEKREACSDDF